MDWIAFIALIAALLFIGFFAGIEIAFVSANKLSIELRRKQGTASGRIWGQFADHPARFIGTTLVGINLVFVIYGLLIGDMLYPIWHWIEKKIPADFSNSLRYIKLFVETVLSTLIVLFVEFVAKAFFRARNNSIIGSDVISYFVKFFFWMLSAIAAFFVDIAEWILKYIFNVKLNKKKDVFSKIDLEHFIQQSKGYEEEDSSELNKELFENALSLSEVKLRECLIPRREIEGVDSRSTISEVKARFISTQLSKLVVYEGNIDNITGYIHQLDLFKNPATVQQVLLPIPTVPESMSATDLMNKFSKERKSIAWVVDEFGGTAGIVTMEDLLEEIFGDIRDEYDTEEFVEKQLSGNEYIFSGRLELDYITEKYKLEFPNDGETETLSGYIIKNNEEIPRLKDRIIIADYEFDILNVSDTRIEMVKLKQLK
ncbi:MAG: HlyC/CorC family transporter [Chitinophagaceae bacterium]|nr:HlyC/CorC family transporter [Chitinophagaceae bacterium]MBL0055727.1 HlyC/CorC family transporter [Chitinophagaceae bacterium]